MAELINRYMCSGEDGRSVEVQEFQRYKTYVADAGVTTAPTTLFCRLAPQEGGGHVNWIDDTKFQIVMTDEILTRN